jgi:hypothetical protein
MPGAIVGHEADVNLTNYIFLARRSRNQKDKNRFSYVIFTTETQNPQSKISKFEFRSSNFSNFAPSRASAVNSLPDQSTTMVYTHVLNRGGRGVNSPADRL